MRIFSLRHSAFRIFSFAGAGIGRSRHDRHGARYHRRRIASGAIHLSSERLAELASRVEARGDSERRGRQDAHTDSWCFRRRSAPCSTLARGFSSA
jgi:hypothetical protein